MPQTVQQTLQDPKFYGLPPGEQQKVLATLDPNYARLPLVERNKVLQMGQQRLNNSASTAPQNTFAAPAGTDGQVLPFLHSNKAGFPVYQGTPATAGRYGSDNPAPPPVDWRTPLTTFTHQSDTPAHAVEDVLGNIGSTGLNVLLRPVDTVKSFARMAADPLRAATDMAYSTLQNPQDASESMIGQGAVFGGLGKLADTVLKPSSTAAAPDWIPPSLRPLIEKTRDAQKLASENADEYAQALRANTENIAKTQTDTRRTAKSEGISAQRNYQQALEDTRNANAAALQAQGKIAPTRAKLDTAVQEMQAQIETAREKSRAIGNQYFNGVNAKLNPLPADMEVVTKGLTDSLDKIKGTEAEPTVLKAVSKRIEAGDALTYEDLQGFYSELGNELSKGTLAGDVYAAYDTMHETIGSDMQRIADSQGMGKQLLNARNYWRRMKQTFGKPYNPTDAANLALDKTAGSVMQRAEQVNRLRLLGSFDRTIPQTALHIANIQKGLESLPKEAPVRDVVQQLPQKPGPVQAPKFEGTPEELAKQTTPLPKGVGKTVIDKADIVSANKEAYTKGLQRAQHWTLYLGAVWPAIEAMRYLVRGEMPTASGAVGIGSSLAARAAMDRIFTNPHVIDFFTKATPKEIAAVPPELRGDLPQIVTAAQSRGVQVSPALMAWVGAVQRNRNRQNNQPTGGPAQ